MTAASATASVYIARSLEPVIDGAVFEGTRPRHSVLVTWPSHVMEVTLRDAYFEFAEAPRGTGVVRLECASLGPHCEESVGFRLYDPG